MRGDQHPFTPWPKEPEEWPVHDAPNRLRWNPEAGEPGDGVTEPGTYIFSARDLKRIADFERRRRAKHVARGFSIGFVGIDEVVPRSAAPVDPGTGRRSTYDAMTLMENQ